MNLRKGLLNLSWVKDSFNCKCQKTRLKLAYRVSEFIRLLQMENLEAELSPGMFGKGINFNSLTFCALLCWLDFLIV